MQDHWFEDDLLEKDPDEEDRRWAEALTRGAQRPSLFAGTAFYWMTCAAFALLQAGIAPLYWLLAGTFAIDATGYLTAMQVLFYLGVLLLPVVAYLLSHPKTVESFRLNPVSPGRTLICAAAAGVGYLAANYVTLLWMLLLEAVGADPAALTADVLSGNLVLDIFVVAVLPGICEELLFRGMVLATFERWGTWKAIWISALLFMGMHGSIAGMPAELLLGLALGWVAASTRSLYACMMLHTTYNAITLIGSYAALDSAEAAMTGSILEQLGGAPGVIVVIVAAALSAAALVLLLRALDKMRRKDGWDFGNDRVIEKKRLGKSEIVLLFSAVCTLGWFYLQDWFSLFGGLL